MIPTLSLNRPQGNPLPSELVVKFLLISFNRRGINALRASSSSAAFQTDCLRRFCPEGQWQHSFSWVLGWNSHIFCDDCNRA